MKYAAVLAGSLCLLAVAGRPAFAGPGDHRWEAGLSFERTTFDDIVIPDLPGFPGSGDTFEIPDSDEWRASGRFYFQQVKTDDVPLGEAAYLGRNSSVELAWSRFDPGFEDVELDSQQLSLEVYVPRTMLYFAGGLARFETVTLINGGDPATDHDTEWFGAVGITPFDGLRVSTYYTHQAGYDPNVAVKYVGKLGGSRFYGFGLRAVDPDEGDLRLSGDIDFFFDPTFSVGAGYDELGDVWSLRAEKFFMSRLGVQAVYTDGDGARSFRIQGSWRF